MDINETYLKFLNKVNKNYINDNVSVDKGRFIIIYNEAEKKYVDWVFTQNNTQVIRNIQILKVKNKELEKKESQNDLDSFKLPSMLILMPFLV